MSRLARLRRTLFRLLIVCFLLGVGAIAALHFYLHSSRATREVEEQLRLALGVPAEVGSAQIALFADSSISDLRLIDEGDGRPFLEAELAETDLSALAYLRGDTFPRHIDLLHAHLRLRFDRDGNLLTALPSAPVSGKPMPGVRLRAARVTVEQQGREPFTLNGISLTLETNAPAGENNLAGVVDDPVWGKLDVTGRVEQGGPYTLTLASKGVALTHAMLKALPLVPAALWTQIEADGPAVGLRFKLAIGTKAPWVHYTVAFDRARIRLPQPDRPPLVVSPTRGVLEGTEDGFLLSGAISDPYWGDWSIAGGLVSRTGALTVELHTRRAVVDQKKLEALPYVPKNVWKQVQASGRTSAHVLVGLSTRNPDVHYRVELAAKETTVHVSSIDLQATGAAGGVIVEDSHVSLRKVTGQTAGGTIGTSGELNFAAEPVRMTFDVDVRGLALRELPKKWDLPTQLEGKLTGQAKLAVTLRDGTTETTGTGKGRIDEVKLVGLPARPIPLELTADGKRIRITPQSTMLHIMLYAACPTATTVPAVLVNKKNTGGPPVPREEDQGAGLPVAQAARLWALTGGPPVPREEDLGAGPPVAQAARLWALTGGPPVLREEDTGGPPVLREPGRLVGQAMSGVGSGVHWIVGGASAVLRQVGRINQAMQPGAQTVYLNANVSLDDVDLADLARRLSVALPVEVAGRLSFQVRVGIPINSARDFKAYRLDGSVRLSRLSIAGFKLADVRGQIHFENGLLRIEKLSGAVGRGTIAGSAGLQVLPRGDLSFDLALRDLAAEQLLRPIASPALRISGTLSGTVRASVALDRLRDPAAWSGLARVNVPALEVQGVSLRDASASLTLLRGLAVVSGLKGELLGSPLAGSATLSLSNTERFEGELQLRGLSVARLAMLLPASRTGVTARGAVTATAEFHGTLRPWNLSASGKLQSGPVQLGGAGLDRLSLGWALDNDTLKVSDFKAALYRGEVTGTATAPLTDGTEGRVDLRISDVDLHALADSVGGLPFRVDGRMSGTAVGKYLPATTTDKPATWSAEMNLSAATMRIRDVPVQKLRGQLQYRDGKAAYRLDGETLGGKLSIEGKLPPPPRGSVGRFDGRLRLDRVPLSRLWRDLRMSDRLGPIHGVLSVDLPFRHEGPALSPVGRGRFEIRDLRYHGNEMAESVRADVRLTGEGIFVRDLSAEFAGGLLRAGLSYRFRDPSRSWFSLSLSRVEASRLMVFDEVKDAAQGPIDLHMRGSLGSEWRGAGTLEMSRGKVLGVEVAEWRMPLEFTFAPRAARSEWVVRESSAQVGRGRAQLRATLYSSDHMRIEGSVRFFEASLRSLAGVVGDVTSYAQGRVTGRIDFMGGEVRSINDLTATAQMTLEDAQPLQLPILNLAVPYLLPGQGATTFRNGELHARLSNGVWRMAQMTLESNLVHLIIQGTLTLQGRLDLIVMGRTTTLGGINPVLLRLLARGLPAVGPVPVGLIIQATELFSNRIIRLHITGTTKSPQVQVEALQVLSEEAARFFITRALVP